ncbi:hypothetical protein CEXT_532331 [Caerostris extrusa]|uniref:Uncharacterized protein n=1 Tax=Caerostris extrusa TaxID=172846 RepID=A0AAV4SU01_CAEEX|nr:hypothetical protein CEXT_532331 [Caerostris extrusa]
MLSLWKLRRSHLTLRAFTLFFLFFFLPSPGLAAKDATAERQFWFRCCWLLIQLSLTTADVIRRAATDGDTTDLQCQLPEGVTPQEGMNVLVFFEASNLVREFLNLFPPFVWSETAFFFFREGGFEWNNYFYDFFG